MLRDEDGMAAHWSLASVILRCSRREAIGNEVPSVSSNDLQPALLKIGRILGIKPEPRSEGRLRKFSEDIVEIVHAVRLKAG